MNADQGRKLKRRNVILLGVGMLVLGWLGATAVGFWIFPSCSLTCAWKAPFGTVGYTSAVRSSLGGHATEDDVIGLLGSPENRLISASGSGEYILEFTNPNNAKRGILVEFNAESEVVRVDAFETSPETN